MIAEFIILLQTVLLIAYLLHRYSIPKGLPPGEWGLPIVGYTPWMTGKITAVFEKLQKKHGDIFSLKLGSHIFIILTDFNLIKTAFGKAEISGRPRFYSFDQFRQFGHLGVVSASDKEWTTNRKFTIKALKEFGFGKSKLEESIIIEAQHLVDDFKEKLNTPIEIDWNVNVAVLNIIWKLVADKRYKISDKEIKDFAQLISENIEDIDGPMRLLDFFPALIPLVPDFVKNSWMRVHIVRTKLAKLYAYFTDVINKHRKTLDANHPRDYIDKYLIELEIQKNNPDYVHWGDSDLLVELFDLFSAGSETTSSTIRWFFLYMAKYPDIQKRVQEEIDRVLQRDKLPSLDDKENLPCLEALSYEIGRIITFVPTALPHKVSEDTTIGGFRIPKDSLVMCNIESCHKDPRYWKYPNELSLENFLDAKGKFVNKTEGYLPFSIGRRLCVGEHLAKMELYLYMGAILQNFDISEPEDQNASLIPDPSVNIINVPEKFKVILKSRA